MIDNSGLGHSAEEFLEQLWAEAGELEELLERPARRQPSRDSVGYRSSWLVRYDHDLSPADEQLKRTEAHLVEATLRQSELWGTIGSYLDIGTCTGRYVGLLRQAVAASGRIVGIDNNLESVVVARANIRRHHPGDPRISVLLRDFRHAETPIPSAPFELMTCMMSTISHFGKDRRPSLEDSLQRALRRMVDLLADNGLLILSHWSRRACANHDLLSIYSPPDLERLAAWTPPAAELGARLEAAGLTACERLLPDPRLDLWICRHR